MHLTKGVYFLLFLPPDRGNLGKKIAPDIVGICQLFQQFNCIISCRICQVKKRKKYQKKGGEIINIKRRPVVNPGRYAIRARALKLRVPLAELLRKANEKTGYKIEPTLFYKGIDGKYYRPSMDKTLEVVDRILAELEIEDKHKIDEV